MLLQVKDKEPLRPRLMVASVPRDVETICLKCLEKSPEKRYGTAQELSDDLGRYLAGEAILARPIGGIGRAVKWAKRRPASAALYGVIVISAVTVAIGSVWYNGRLRAALSESLHQKSLAEEQRAAAEQQTVLARHASVRISTRSGQWPMRNDPRQARAVLNNTPAELRDFTWRWMAGRCQQLPQTTIVTHDPSIVAVVELPDHQTLLTAGERVTRWSLAGSASVGEWPGRCDFGSFHSLAVLRDGSLIAAGGDFGCIRAWSGDGTPKLNLTKRGTIVAIALSDDGRHIAYASQVMTGRCEVFRLSLEEAATERVIASDVRNIVQMTMADRDTLLMVMSSDGAYGAFRSIAASSARRPRRR